LEKVVHREVLIQGDLVHPSIPIKSIANLPTFSLRDVVDKEGDINRLPTSKPRGSPKGGLPPVAKGDGGGGIEDVHVVFGTRVCGAPPNLGVVGPLKPRPTQPEGRGKLIQANDSKAPKFFWATNRFSINFAFSTGSGGRGRPKEGLTPCRAAGHAKVHPTISWKHLLSSRVH
jgi:hypothetical protein